MGATHPTYDDDNLRAANGMSERQGYCGRDALDQVGPEYFHWIGLAFAGQA